MAGTDTVDSFLDEAVAKEREAIALEKKGDSRGAQTMMHLAYSNLEAALAAEEHGTGRRLRR